MWHLDGTPGFAVTLLHAGPWGVPGHRSGLPWLPGHGHGNQRTACSRMAGPRGLLAPPGALASPRGVGVRLSRRAGLAEIQASPQPLYSLVEKEKVVGPGLESQHHHSLG